MNDKIKIFRKLPFGMLLSLEIFVIIFMNFFYISGVPSGVSAESAVSGTRWMAQLPDDTNLCDINMPGTHDSGTKYTFGILSGIVASCQDDTIPEQLEKGIRYLDIRCDGDLDINHSGVTCYTNILTIDRYKLTFPKVLDDVEKFLEENPTEAVMLRLKKEGVSRENFFEKVNNLLKEYDKIYQAKTSYPHNIKLGDLRGKILVCSSSKEIEYACHYHGWSCSRTVCFMHLDESVCALQDRYQPFMSKEKLSIIESFYEKIWSEDLDDKFVINFTSCVGPYCPELVARRINPEFEKFIKKNKNKKFGIVLMDVPTDSLISEIYGSNFL